jgi:hypothetical protein
MSLSLIQKHKKIFMIYLAHSFAKSIFYIIKFGSDKNTVINTIERDNVLNEFPTMIKYYKLIIFKYIYILFIKKSLTRFFINK